MDQIKIGIKKTDNRSLGSVTIFIGIIHAIIFLAAFLYRGISVAPVVITAAALLVILGLPKASGVKIRKDFLYILFMLLWIYLDNYWMAMLNILLFIFSYFSAQPIYFIFTKNNINRTGFFSKTYEWSSLNNVILKDSILTLDFKNNRMIQVETTQLDEKEEYFNNFAREGLNNTLEAK